MKSTATYRVIRGTEQDLDQLKPLWHQLLAHHHHVAAKMATLGRPLSIDESWTLRREQYLNWLATAAGCFWVARQNEIVVAYCFVHLAEGNVTWDWGKRTGMLESLVVTDGFRGRGLGSQLIALADRYFTDRDVEVVKVSAVASNEGALRLYRRLGFVDQLVTLVKSVDPVPRQ